MTTRIWIYLVAAWLLMPFLCLGQSVLLSWPTNNPYLKGWTLLQSTNAGASWFVLTNGDFDSCVVPATGLAPSFTLTNSEQYQGVGFRFNSNDCTPYNQFKIEAGLATQTPVMSGSEHWFEADWERATNWSVQIKVIR